MRCAAITQRTERYQQVWRKDCENSATQMVNGVPLCGSHINALARGPVLVRHTLETPPEFARLQTGNEAGLSYGGLDDR